MNLEQLDDELGPMGYKRVSVNGGWEVVDEDNHFRGYFEIKDSKPHNITAAPDVNELLKAYL